ncbi:MAG: isocitrate/isopropylmalate family dehydrogenase, partial [Acidimicrobiia bacterium]|nr:isocitrate/isopropylmalate family dehydrogenase [Acidimicrobiia bacterium]
MAEKITLVDGDLRVPDNPIIPFIEGDGTGVDIWPAAQLVLDAAAKEHGKSIEWVEVLAGQKAFDQTGEWLPEATVQSILDHLIGIKGPLTTPVGGGIRSLNVTIRQALDLYACVRPVRYFPGAPSPMKEPEKLNVVIFRENTEDVYAGHEWPSGSPEARKLIEFVREQLGRNIDETSGIGIKPISPAATKRLMRMAIRYC